MIVKQVAVVLLLAELEKQIVNDPPHPFFHAGGRVLPAHARPQPARVDAEGVHSAAGQIQGKVPGVGFKRIFRLPKLRESLKV